MNLNESSIRKGFESYMNSTGTKGYKIAEMCGMSSASMFSQYLTGVTKSLKAEYLIHFLYNAKIDLNKFLNQNIYRPIEELAEASDVKIKYFNCPECIKKQNTINDVEAERDSYRQKYIECLEELAGRDKKTS